MKTILAITAFTFSFSLNAWSQDLTAKEKAEALAQTEFSKEKYKRKEKGGFVKEMHKVIVSTPVINSDPSFYQGNYLAQGSAYQLEIRQDSQQQWLVTLKIDGTETILKNVVIKDGYFSARKTNNAETEEWEGAFINKNDNGTVDFGLGVKLSNSLQLDGVQLSRLFFKKISP